MLGHSDTEGQTWVEAFRIEQENSCRTFSRFHILSQHSQVHRRRDLGYAR